MGSVQLPSGIQRKGFLGKKQEDFIYFQFVHGVVVETVTHKDSLRAGNDYSNVNTIIAKPHLYDTLPPKKSEMSDKYRYKPLLRGINEIPAKGDPVLLCTMGGENYYLGPLNTENKVTWNVDKGYITEIVMNESTPAGRGEGLTSGQKKGESKNFQKSSYERLQKTYVPSLDHPNLSDGAVFESHGDIMLEGRHGNSIRIGSRHKNPYMFFSNKRPTTAKSEHLTDGSIISITSRGNLAQHFPATVKVDGSQDSFVPDFVFSSEKGVTEIETADGIKKSFQSPLIANLFKSFNNTSDITGGLYGFNKNQIFVRSTRLVFDSRNDLFLSSCKDFYIASQQNIGISCSKSIVLDSKNIYLGSPDTGDSTLEMEPIILGNKLFELLEELVDTLKTANANIQGVPVPLIESTEKGMGLLGPKIDSIGRRLNTIKSNFHFIEPNDR